jgi:lipoate-protein ligase A
MFGGVTMTRAEWRYFDDGPQQGAYNMALDETLLESYQRGETPPTLRVYTWNPPAISLGKFQQAETSLDLEACRAAGVEVVRRPTGGRAILHTEQEVTFSVIVAEEQLGTSGIMDSYRVLAGGIVAGLQLLGLEAKLVERTGAGGAARAQDPACFAVKARCDLVVGESKLVGSAQVHREGAILQQNSLPLHIELADWERLFRRKAEVPQATGLWEAAGRNLAYSEVANALRMGFEKALEIIFSEGRPSPQEHARAEELMRAAGIQ